MLTVHSAQSACEASAGSHSLELASTDSIETQANVSRQKASEVAPTVPMDAAAYGDAVDEVITERIGRVLELANRQRGDASPPREGESGGSNEPVRRRDDAALEVKPPPVPFGKRARPARSVL